MKKKKTIIYVVFLILVLTVFSYTEFSGRNIKKQSGKVFLDGDDSNFILTIKNTLPITDEVGKTLSWDNTKKDVLGYIEFSVMADTLTYYHEYELYLTDVSDAFAINSDYIKIYLTDGEDIPIDIINNGFVTSYSQLRVAESDLSGKRLYAGILGKGKSQKFKLRMWLADTYSFTAEEKEFSVKINVKTIS